MKRTAGSASVLCGRGVDPDVRRRDVLAGLAGVAGSLGLAGCSGLFGTDPAADETLTPAPVPTTRRSTAGPAAGGDACPEVPAPAEVYVCAGTTGDDSVRLVPEASTYDAGSGPFTVTLRNESSLSFRTGRDQWILSQRIDGTWTVVDQGAGTDLLSLRPGESFVWVLGGVADSAGAGDAAGTERLEVAVGGGQHALAVVGAPPRGARTAAIARFRIEPSLG